MEHSAKIVLPLNPGKRGLPTAAVRPILRFKINVVADNTTISSGNNSTSLSSSISWVDFAADVSYLSNNAAQSPVSSVAEDVANLAGDITSPRPTSSEDFLINHQRSRITLPRTPANLRMTPKPLSSEERELVLISEMQRALAKRRELNQEILYRNTGFKILVMSCSRLTTKLSRVQPEYKEYNFIKELRKYPISTHVAQVQTIPKPFSLSSSKKICAEPPVKRYTSVAEYINIFEHYAKPGSSKRPRCKETSATTLNSSLVQVLDI